MFFSFSCATLKLYFFGRNKQFFALPLYFVLIESLLHCRMRESVDEIIAEIAIR